jgi:hypothetical protein
MSDQKRIDELEAQLTALKLELIGGHAAAVREEIESKIKLLDDPFSIQRPYKIDGEIAPDEAHPKGQVLRWLNMKSRDQRGWRGWTVLKYGDEYTGKTGELLKAYIPDPPNLMAGQAKEGVEVRRGDAVLGRLPKELYVARQLRRELASAHARGEYTTSQDKIIREGLSLISGGGFQGESRKEGLLEKKEMDSIIEGASFTRTTRSEYNEKVAQKKE